MGEPRIRLQMGTLYASNDASWFTGTGGPQGYSPWTNQFGGVVGSAGLAAEPFDSVLHNVAAGDEVIFVVAVENLGDAAATGLRLRIDVPPGFVRPADGLDLGVTDGAGTVLGSAGDLLSAAGLTVVAPVAAYDAASGANIVLLTYSLVASASLAVPDATLRSTATVLAVRSVQGGGDLASGVAPAVTTVLSAAPAPTMTATADPSAVARGQVVAFDVAVPIPQGTLNDVRLALLLPGGTASLGLVDATVLQIGSGLRTGPVVAGADGTLGFGTVVNAAASDAAATIVVRVTLRAQGSLSGPASVTAQLSAADPDQAGARWSTGVSSTVGVLIPPAPPVLSGLWLTQSMSTLRPATPFATLSIAGGDQVRPATLAIVADAGSGGRFAAVSAGSLDPSGRSFFMTGTPAALQEAARALTFQAGTAGTTRFTITLVDGAGTVAQSTATTVRFAAPASTPAADPLFDYSYYLLSNPDVLASGVDAYTQFMTVGWTQGRNPDPWFDMRYYLRMNPDVAAAGVNPLAHFAAYGWAENRDPSLAFSLSGYLNANPDIRATGWDPLAHFVQQGQFEGRTAVMAGPQKQGEPDDTMVDDAYVQRQVATITPQTLSIDGWFHATGWTLGINPNAWFDTGFYLARNPDVRAAGIDPLTHYEQYGWREGRDPSLLFSAARYRTDNPDVGAAGVEPLQHWLDHGIGEGRIVTPPGGLAPADPLIDAAYYGRQLGATLLPAAPVAAQQAAWSYDATGWRAGLNPDTWFDTAYYLSHNPDVAVAGINPLQHYEHYGWTEHRDPSAQFSTDGYLTANPDVRAAGVNPLVHWMAYGQFEGRSIVPV